MVRIRFPPRVSQRVPVRIQVSSSISAGYYPGVGAAEAPIRQYPAAGGTTPSWAPMWEFQPTECLRAPVQRVCDKMPELIGKWDRQ
jgi:hypothetical protein